MLNRIIIALWLLAALLAGINIGYSWRSPRSAHAVQNVRKPVSEPVPNAALYKKQQIEIIAAAIPASALNYRGKK